ncbi:P-loop containing nucleoside triphosphate hydrolase protein, partial [Mycena latifolia]
LPGKPQIFHGRQSELNFIVANLIKEYGQISILGAGGMGKTSLAKAALHHADVAAKYEARLFVAADSVTNSIELAGLIGSHLGLKPGKNMTKRVVQHFSGGPPLLLVLDNLETPWEPMGTHSGVEEFLSLLTDVEHLALMITMRGVERPAKVHWTHPFLPPLQPLSNEAVRQIFKDIADDFHDSRDIDKLLQITDNMPLAVDLIVHLVDFEGCASILTRWKTEGTSLLSDGHDKRSSLDASIAISLSSPRMATLPGAKDLLSFLSVLPDGLSDVELGQCPIPINNLPGCRTALLRTSLAYYDDKRRLKSLAPIREHIRSCYPPSPLLIQPLCKYFHLLLDFYRKYLGVLQKDARITQITSNLDNLEQLL